LPEINSEIDAVEPLGSVVILVVDDEAMILNITRAALEKCGYSILTAKNGKEAVDVFQAHVDEVTMVLLDLTMPVMGGAEAYTLMTRIRPGIPIVISSGYGESDVRGKFSGALAGVINKPYTTSQLRRRIADVLMRKSGGAAGSG
jgi:CheY-like chemotaxis protein